ncbi:MAG: type III PLP-dependent enzyme [Paracoccaceae bacterium]|nr:type III PLP-dependent enzyme [Paracoccaceae bacterium]
MYASDPLAPSLHAHLWQSCPDRPVLYFSPKSLQENYRRFASGFDGLVTYVVKANASCLVLDNLALAGLTTFDVASPVEMQTVRAAVPNAVLHYHNPVRSPIEIAAAKRFGIRSWSVDSREELDKLSGLPSGAEIAVRLYVPVAGAAYDFGLKFGAGPAQAAALLRCVKQRGLTPSLTFHPGTQCTDPAAWVQYIDVAYEVSQRAETALKRLNVGGGFTVWRERQAPDLERVFDRISDQTIALFGAKSPALVCEPGRAMVASAFTLAVKIKALRGLRTLFLNDGIYGLLAEFRDLGVPQRYQLWRAGRRVTGPSAAYTVFGPTCDSIDQLPSPLHLPKSAQEGDYLLFPAIGAYSLSLATSFNGYGGGDIVAVGDL